MCIFSNCWSNLISDAVCAFIDFFFGVLIFMFVLLMLVLHISNHCPCFCRISAAGPTITLLTDKIKYIYFIYFCHFNFDIIQAHYIWYFMVQY